MINIAIIGGGAAGCFCAIELKRKLPYANVNIYEGYTYLLRSSVYSMKLPD